MSHAIRCSLLCRMGKKCSENVPLNKLSHLISIVESRDKICRWRNSCLIDPWECPGWNGASCGQWRGLLATYVALAHWPCPNASTVRSRLDGSRPEVSVLTDSQGERCGRRALSMWALGSKPRAPHWEVFCGLFLPFRMPGARNASAAGHFFGTAGAHAHNVGARWPIESFHSLVLVSKDCAEPII